VTCADAIHPHYSPWSGSRLGDTLSHPLTEAQIRLRTHYTLYGVEEADDYLDDE
jgi:hypothetical protein